MNAHDQEIRQRERQDDRDGVIVGTYDSIEDATPGISTENLLQRTADSAWCSVDRVVAALRRRGRLTPSKK